MEKRGESYFKTKRATKTNAKLISAVHPDMYANRFVNFMKDTVVINQVSVGGNQDKVVPNSLVETILSHNYSIEDRKVAGRSQFRL